MSLVKSCVIGNLILPQVHCLKNRNVQFQKHIISANINRVKPHAIEDLYAKNKWQNNLMTDKCKTIWPKPAAI